MNATINRSPWAGWFRRRPGDPWRMVCEGESEAECSSLIAGLISESGDVMILPSGRRPDDLVPAKRASLFKMPVSVEFRPFSQTFLRATNVH